jgi:hypothetical protein
MSPAMRRAKLSKLSKLCGTNTIVSGLVLGGII